MENCEKYTNKYNATIVRLVIFLQYMSNFFGQMVHKNVLDALLRG